MPSFEIPADIFTRLSVFDSPKGSSNTFKTRKKYRPVFRKKVIIIYKYCLVCLHFGWESDLLHVNGKMVK